MRGVLGFVAGYMLRYVHWYLFGTLALVLTNWFATTIPLYVADAIDAIDLGQEGMNRVAHDALIVACMGLGIMLARTTSRILFFTPGRLVEASVKEDLFSRIIVQQPAFIGQWPPGDLVSRASSDINHLRLLAGFGALQIVNVTVVLTLVITQMSRLSMRLTIWTIVPLLVGLVITRICIRWLFILVRRIQRQLADLSDFVLSSYQGVATIQGHVGESAFLERFEERNHQLLDTVLKRAALRTVISPVLGFATSVCVFTLLYIGGPMAIRGEITPGELVAFVALVALLASPLRGLSFLLAVFKQAQASLERIDEVRLPDPERPDLPHPQPAPEKPPGLEVRNLSFSYPGEETDALQGISVSIQGGQTLGILGTTGSGKTTLLRCLSRLYNPPPGTVFVDGQDVRDIHLDEWRGRCVLVPQVSFLFSESLRSNVLLGRADEERLDSILELTALAADLKVLPDGVHTEVGEAGLMLSGGQRQRVALARGLVRDPVVLMLDDVLSAVDHETEHRLIGTLKAKGQQPTTVIVAHRISALQHADRILVLDQGSVSDSGSHGELVSRPGLYRDTWEKQQEVNIDV